MNVLSAQRSTLARELSGLLADTYVLYNTTQNYHWNVEGPHFKPLHELFEMQYTEMAEAIDMIAERIRTLGFYTPGTLKELETASRVQAAKGAPVDAKTMLDQLIEGHQVVVHRLREIQQTAEKQMDEATMDMLVERQRVHEKAAWFLRSQAGSSSETVGTPASASVTA